MPGCSAIGCRNTSYKGFAMKNFPRDPKRRKEWADRVKRDNWYPTDKSTLCEIHFASEMWERNRVDGKKKLVYNAVPTIFPHQPREESRRQSALYVPIALNEKNELLHVDSMDEYEESLRRITNDVQSSTTTPPKLMTFNRKRTHSNLSNEMKIEFEESNYATENSILESSILDHCYAKIIIKNELNTSGDNQIEMRATELQTPDSEDPTGDETSTVTSLSWEQQEEADNKQLHFLITVKNNKQNEFSDQKIPKPSNKNPTKLRPLLPKGPIILAGSKNMESISLASNVSSVPIIEPTAGSTLPISVLRTNSVVDATSKPPEAPVLLETATTESQKLLLYEKLCRRQKATIAAYRNRTKNNERKVKKLEEQLTNLTSCGTNICDIFNNDQIAALQRKTVLKSTKFMKWSDPTIFKALRLKFTCGVEGYEELLKQNIPLPSEKTLQRRLQNVEFEPGILNQVFEFLKIKIDCFNTTERDCCMILEEMEIVPESTYDAKLHKHFGDITLRQYSGKATHVQVFILAGINTKWKQIVGYYFTGNTIEDCVFKGIVNTLLQKAREINLNVISITTDLDASNQVIWGNLNLNLGRHKTVKNTICHPLEPAKKMFVFADVPKLFKQFKLMLIMNKIITIPEYFQEKYKLPTNVISSTHIFDLISLQTVFRFRLVPKASLADLLPYDFDKATAFSTKSKNVQNVDISSALKLVAKLHKQPEYLTTAWFIDILGKWYELMTSKSPVTALSKYKEADYKETINFLYNFMEIVDYMEVGRQKVWKITQTGALVSTKSMIQLQNVLLNQKNYNLLLTGRFSTNYLENLFNVLKAKKITANAQNVQQNLKILCVAQYLKCTKGSCFDEDDRAIFQRSNFVGASQEIQLEDLFDETNDQENCYNESAHDETNHGEKYMENLCQDDGIDEENSSQNDIINENNFFDDIAEEMREDI